MPEESRHKCHSPTTQEWQKIRKERTKQYSSVAEALAVGGHLHLLKKHFPDSRCTCAPLVAVYHGHFEIAQLFLQNIAKALSQRQMMALTALCLLEAIYARHLPIDERLSYVETFLSMGVRCTTMVNQKTVLSQAVRMEEAVVAEFLIKHDCERYVQRLRVSFHSAKVPRSCAHTMEQ